MSAGPATLVVPDTPAERSGLAGGQSEELPHGQGSGRPFAFDVAVIGLGYVGLPTALSFHAAGDRVLGIDLDPRRLTAVAAERADLVASDRARLATALAGNDFEMSESLARLAEAAAVVICVPTPVDEHRQPDLRILRQACASAVAHAVAGQTLLLTSTSFVGCTRELLVAALARRGLRCGVEVSVAFSPERIDPGNERVGHEAVPRVVGGASPACAAAAARLVGRSTAQVHVVDSLEVAEMSKLVENTFRAVNIALANEFADICGGLGISVTDVIDAAATKPYGFLPFFPGPGVGGQCIPCDPHYLLWQLRRTGAVAPLTEEAMTQIAHRPARIVERARESLATVGAGLGGSRVLVVGVTYKPNVADTRESPAVEILSALRATGATVAYHDPFVPTLRLCDGALLQSVAAPADFAADLVVLHTAHTALELGWLAEVPAVLDATYRLEGVAHSEVP